MSDLQPLSPTAVVARPLIDQSAGGPSGPPQHIGLSQVDYAVDERLTYHYSPLNESDDTSSKLHGDLPQWPGIVSFRVHLPFDMIVSQVSVHLRDKDQFQKHLRLFQIKRADSTGVPVRRTYADKKASLIEVNTVALATVLEFRFLFSRTVSQQKESMKTVHDRIKNDILPFLNDSSNDEIDDEVAMISQKNTRDYVRVEDITVEMNQNGTRKPNKDLVLHDFDDFDIRKNKETQKLRGLEDDEESDLSPAALLMKDGSVGNFTEQSVGQYLQKVISTIKVIGFNCNSMQAVTNLTVFMNDAFYLKGLSGFEHDIQEIEFLMASLLLTSKRSIQAVEAFRKLQAQYIAEIKSTKSDRRKLFAKAAVLEMLCAESMTLPAQINERLYCLERASSLFIGKLVDPEPYQKQIQIYDCPYTALTRLMPNVLKCVIACMTHKKEVVKIGALKCLEFLLDTLGCSLDQALQFILKAILQTYPNKNTDHLASDSLNSSESNSSNPVSEKEKLAKTEYMQLQEPASGYPAMIKNAYNHLLETYTQVLSSVSSHILHQLFYDVIIPAIIGEIPKESTPDTKVITIKIAEKIINICQGDLVLDKKCIDTFLQCKLSNEQNAQSFKSLWSNVKSKVFAHYSGKTLHNLVDWIVEKFTKLGSDQRGTPLSKLELTEVEMNTLLTLVDLASVLALGIRKAEEETNQLIRIPIEPSPELWMLVNPLIFWLEFSIERDDRFSLFKNIYAAIKEVTESLPAMQRMKPDMLAIMIPVFRRMAEHLQHNSPTLNTLKFLDIVLKDIKSVPQDLCPIFLDVFTSFVPHMLFTLYEDVYPIFDRLLGICGDILTEDIVKICINALVDRYNFKNKSQKNSLSIFTKSLIEVQVKTKSKVSQRNNNLDSMEDEEISLHSRNNFFEVMCDFCFFENEDVKPGQHLKSNDFKSLIDLHDIFMDKLQYFIDTLSLLNELHVNMFMYLTTHPGFKHQLVCLLQKGETNLKIKAHDILEAITNYYVNYCSTQTRYEIEGRGGMQAQHIEAEYINQERLYLSQIVVQCARISLEAKGDAYLQFHGLILLDNLFSHMLPVPTYQNEQIKGKAGTSNQVQTIVIDVEHVEINERTPEFEVIDSKYLNTRLNLVFKFWPFVQQALNSSWSNIRSICYGLICSMVKIDVKDCPASHNKLKQLVLPLLMSLLSSKESESKAGGLNILGSFCGLSYDFSKVAISRNLDFFVRNSDFISFQVWQLVFDLQDDWDITIKEASVVLIQLCAPREAVKYCNKVKKERQNMQINILITNGSRGGSAQSNQDENYSDQMLNQINSFFSGDQNSLVTENRASDVNPMLLDSDVHQRMQKENMSLEDETQAFAFFVDKYNDEQIQEIISIFRNDFKPPKNLWIEKNPNNNAPDYYNEIYSNAIEQMQQQQQIMSAQQNQQIQLKVDQSKQKVPQLDVLEDNLVNKMETENKIKHDILKQTPVQLDSKEGTIDAEPYQFLEDGKHDPISVKDENTKSNNIDAKNMQLFEQIDFDELGDDYSPPQSAKEDDFTHTDMMIEKFDNIIVSTTKMLEQQLEAEKKQRKQRDEEGATIDSQHKQTPEFKSKKVKKDLSPIDPSTEILNQTVPKYMMSKKQQQSHLNDLNRGFISSLDNKNLMKQINQCFPLESTRSVAQKKLNKSLENLFSNGQKNLLLKQDISRSQSKKNQSSSPRKQTKKAHSKNSNKGGLKPQIVIKQQNPKALYGMRDLNFFIKTIEKDLSDKFNKLTMKDFNSMPTTPTSILKKVEDQVKALQKTSHQAAVKQQMSNTCPNISHILRQLDIQNTEVSPKGKPEQIQVPNTNRTNIDRDMAQFKSQGQTPSNVSAASTNNFENFSFSKTQKFDFKDQMKNVFNYMSKGSAPGGTARDNSNEKFRKVSPLRSQQPMIISKGKKTPGSSRRSRGSQSKISSSSGSNAGKLNKSAVFLSSYASQQTRKKDSSSKGHTQRTKDQSGEKGTPITQLKTTGKYSEVFDLSPSTEERMRKALYS